MWGPQPSKSYSPPISSAFQGHKMGGSHWDYWWLSQVYNMVGLRKDTLNFILFSIPTLPTVTEDSGTFGYGLRLCKKMQQRSSKITAIHYSIFMLFALRSVVEWLGVHKDSRNMDFCRFYLCCLWAVWPWANYLTSLCLSFSFKTGLNKVIKPLESCLVFSKLCEDV